MSVIYDLEHTTTYRYAKPVTFGQHRAIFLPRGSHGGRILNYALDINLPAQVRWMMDTLSNNVALIDIDQPGDELTVTYRVRGEHFGYRAIQEYPSTPEQRNCRCNTPRRMDGFVGVYAPPFRRF